MLVCPVYKCLGREEALMSLLRRKTILEHAGIYSVLATRGQHVANIMARSCLFLHIQETRNNISIYLFGVIQET